MSVPPKGPIRHCERSEAIQEDVELCRPWIASSPRFSQ
jgi:hypothetical protein